MVAHEDAHHMYTSYLVLASWDVAPPCATSLIVRNDDGFNRMAKLKIRDLGATGSMQLLLTSDSRIELQAKDRWWRQPQCTESIVLRFRRHPVLRLLRTELRQCQLGVLKAPDLHKPSLNLRRLRSDALIRSTKRLIPVVGGVNDLITSPDLRKAPSTSGIDEKWLAVARRVVAWSNSKEHS